MASFTWPQAGGSSGLPGGFFGDGSDGAAILDGINTFSWASLSGSTYTLLRTIYPTNLTINSGIILIEAPYMIFCTGILTNAGTIDSSGANGSPGAASTGGAQGAGGGALPGGDINNPEFNAALSGVTGRSSSSGTGTDAIGGRSQTGLNIIAGNGGAGGTGTAGAGGAGGTAGSIGTPFIVTFKKLVNTFSIFNNGTGTADILSGGYSGASDGASGAGDSVNNGGAGGGSGGNGSICAIFASTINNLGIIQSNGGAGGNGESPAAGNCGGGGGGGGGAGGFIYIIANTWTSSGTLHVIGGTAGAKGLKHGTGTDGSNGTAGATGIVLKYNGTTGAWI